MKKENKKINLWMMIGLILFVIGVNMSIQVQAEEKEYIQLNQEIEIEKNKHYYFELPTNGKLESEEKINCIIKKNNEIVARFVSMGGAVYQSCRLPSGEYSIIIYNPSKVKLNFTEESSSNYEQEFNDSFDTANEISTNILYNGNLHFDERTNEDYFSFYLPASGSVYLETELMAPLDMTGADFTLYKEDNNLNVTEVLSIYNSWYNGHGEKKKTKKVRLEEGRYFITVKRNTSTYDCPEYQFKVVYNDEPVGNYENESNNTLDTANEMLPNVGYIGNIDSNKDIDYYKIILPSQGKISLRLQTPRQTKNKLFKTELLKSTENDMLKTLDTVYSSENPVMFGKEQLLEAGIYYVKVQSENPITDEDTHVDYTIHCVYDEEILVKNITISSDKNKLNTGDIVQLSADILPENAANRSLKWTSSDSKVAKVDNNGKLTCVAPGKAIISAKAQDGSNIYGEFQVVINKRLIENIELRAEKNKISIGEKVAITAQIIPSNADNTSIIWESTNPRVAKVSQKGVVTAVSAGKTSIKAIAEDGSEVVGSFTIEVIAKKSNNANLNGIKISKGKLNKKFSVKRTDYVLTLNRGSNSVKITPNADNKYASFTINGKKAKSITVKVAPKKSQWVKIVVKAQAGNKKTYKIKVVRK